MKIENKDNLVLKRDATLLRRAAILRYRYCSAHAHARTHTHTHAHAHAIVLNCRSPIIPHNEIPINDEHENDRYEQFFNSKSLLDAHHLTQLLYMGKTTGSADDRYDHEINQQGYTLHTSETWNGVENVGYESPPAFRSSARSLLSSNDGTAENTPSGSNSNSASVNLIPDAR